MNKIRHVFRSSSLSYALLVFIGLSSCEKQVADFVKGAMPSPASNAKLDFQKTEIIVSGLVPADGVSPLIVVLQLKNSDNSSVPNYLPKYAVNSATGVLASNCTASDANGISACIVKSTSPGIKSFQLTNAKVGLAKDIEFGAPQGFQKLSLVSGARTQATTPQGSSLQASFGAPLAGAKLKTSGGYTVSFGLQGVVR